MKRTRPIILLVGLCLGLGGGLLYLESTQTGQHAPTQVVGALGTGNHDTVKISSSNWPEGWVSIAGGPDDPAVINVSGKTPTSQMLDFKLPGFYQEDVLIAGRPCTRISVPGLIKIQEVGLPELPIVATTLIVPEGGETRVKIIEHRVREIKMDPVEPSVGHLTRNVDPATVIPEFDDFYDVGGVFPKEPIDLSKPFSIREYQGVNVRFNPLRYDSGKGALVVTELLIVDIITEGGQEKRLTFATGSDLAGTGFGGVYGRLFDNFTAPAAAMDKYQRLQTQGRMLIISHDAFAPYLQSFMNWKRQRGIDVTLKTMGEIGGSTAGISQAIQTMYDEPAGLTWVILVGDKEQVPTQVGLYDGSDSDSRYTMVAGKDIYPDLFISRISASNPSQVQTQVNRFVAYEKTPDTGNDADWYGHAAGVASNEGNPSDFKRADYLREDLIGYGFQKVDQIYEDQGGSTAMINSALEKGCSMINYLGHGSGYGWTSVPFSSSNVHAQDVGRQWPWIIDVACSNGDFDLPECFAEAWLRAGTPDEPGGAVAMIAASSLAPWVPPSVMQAEAIDLLVGDQVNTIGSLYYSGLMRVLDQYAGLDVAMQVMEQNVIFGDCSLMVRTRAPQEFAVSEITALDASATSWTLEVSGPEGSVVTLTSSDTLHGAGLINAVGQAVVNISVDVEDRSALTLTVSGYNMVPYLDTVAVTNEGGGFVSPEPEPEPIQPAKVALLGNYPNPFNPSTHIVFELPRELRVQLSVYDIRGTLVRVLANEMRSAGRQEIQWDGRDSGGRTAASGVYLYQLITPDEKLSGRMLLTK